MELFSMQVEEKAAARSGWGRCRSGVACEPSCLAALSACQIPFKKKRPFHWRGLQGTA